MRLAKKFNPITISLLIAFTALASGQSQSPNQVDPDQACKPYTSSVVEFINGDLLLNGKPGSGDYGSGFVISQDGLIATAAHFVIDERTSQYRRDITVIVPKIFHGHAFEPYWGPATPVVSAQDALKHDVVLLKVNATKIDGSGLDHLELAEDGSANDGEDVLLIGFPGMRATCEVRSILREQGYGIIYKGVAIGGISGGPIISLKSGKVVGLVNARGTSKWSRNTATGESYGTDIAAIHELLKKMNQRGAEAAER